MSATLRALPFDMPKHLIKRYTPSHDYVRNHKLLRMFGRMFRDPNLWHLNRRSVSGAIFVGIFWAFVPVPGQMFGAIFTAILARVNVPIAFGLIFVTNPLTIPPTFYFAYRVGNWVLGTEPTVERIRLSWEWLQATLDEIWLELLVGSLICGLLFGALGFLAMRVFWRWYVIRKYQRRRGAPPGRPDERADSHSSRPSSR